MASVLRVLARGGRLLRDAWLIAGVTLVLILAIESAYRLQMLVRFEWLAPAAAPGPPSPFASTPWAADYWIGHQKEEAVLWSPYVYRRNPTFQAPHAEVDNLGHRITPMSESAPKDAPAVRIFFMGGSTTFGWYQRAPYTIPAEAARRLQAEFGKTVRVEATNFGVPGHTFTQEILELILQLRAGARPDVVMFYDGINDVKAAVQNGEAGLPQNEANRARDFIRGRLLAADGPPTLASNLRALRLLAADIISQLGLVRRLQNLKEPPAAPARSAESLAKAIANMHAENARLVEALAATYGFVPIYVWQPSLLSTRKPLTPREAWLRRPEVMRYVQSTGDVHMAVPAVIGPAMAPIAGSRFIDATDLFRDETLDIYVDLIGHTYEKANPVIVETLMPSLTAAVSRRLR